MADISALSTSNTYTDAAVNAKITAINLQHKELQTAINKAAVGLFTKLSDPGNLPTGAVNGVSWSSSGSYLAAAHATSPYVTAYSLSGTTFTKISDPGTLPPGEGRSIAWSPSEGLLLVGSDSSPYLVVYTQSGGSLSYASTQPNLAPSGPAYSVAFSPNGENIAVGMSATPYLRYYGAVVPGATTITWQGDGSSIPGTVTGCTWSPDLQFLAYSTGNSPYVGILQNGNTFPTNAVLWTRQVNNV
jgi:WD40 repeat protein